jgi:hypothetical protein
MDYLPGFNDYMAALFADLYWWQGRQLEAAPGLKDCVCPVTLIERRGDCDVLVIEVHVPPAWVVLDDQERRGD